jgi:hypothetical protein
VAVFLWWMLAFLGFPLGGLLALVLVGPVEGAVSSALGEALAGAVIGAAGSFCGAGFSSQACGRQLSPSPGRWAVTWATSVDVERGYYMFGASGALVFAALTGLAMLFMLRSRTR